MTGVLFLLSSSHTYPRLPTMPAVVQEFPRFDVEEKLAELSVPDKIRLLGGKVRVPVERQLACTCTDRGHRRPQDFWCLEDVPDKGVPSVRTSDGPNGVRGRRFFNGVPSSCFPCGTGLAASFDLDMMRRVGEALADECRAKSAHVLLGPTCVVQRPPSLQKRLY